MTYQFSETATREVVAAIRQLDERADSRSWRWLDMHTTTRLDICQVLFEHLTDTQCCDIINDAAISRGKALLTDAISLQMRALLMLDRWFIDVIEPRVKARIIIKEECHDVEPAIRHENRQTQRHAKQEAQA